MPFNASGVFSLVHDWTEDRDNDILIDPDRMDAQHGDIRDAVNAIVNGTQAFIAPISFADGTASAPAIAFTSDTNTGVFLESDGVMALASGGDKELEVKNGIVNVVNGLQIGGVDVNLTSANITTLAHTSGAIAIDFSDGSAFTFEADEYSGGALSFVGGASTAGSSLSLPSMQDGDLCILVQVGSSASVTPSGWTEIYDENGANPDHTVSYKRMGASPDTSVSVAGEASAAIAIRGTDSSTPLDAAYQRTYLGATSGSTAIDPPSVTTVTNNAWNIAILTARLDTALTDLDGGSMTGYTFGAELHDNGSTFDNYVGLAYKEIALAGVENPPAHSESRSPSSFFGWYGYSQPLRPATGSGVKDYTVSVSNIPASGKFTATLFLEIKTTAGSVVFPAAWEWEGGTAPTLNTVGVHEVRVTYLDGANPRAEHIGRYDA